MEEFQVYFELADQKKNKEFAAVLSRIGAMGPSAGVIPVSLSQKPSGVGSGDVQRLFNRYRDNHTIRFGTAVRHPRRVERGPRQRGVRRGLRRLGPAARRRVQGHRDPVRPDRRRAHGADLPRRRRGRRGHLPGRSEAAGEEPHAVRRRARRPGRRAGVRHRGRPAQGHGAATPGCGGRRRPSGSRPSSRCGTRTPRASPSAPPLAPAASRAPTSGGRPGATARTARAARRPI